MDTLSPTPLVNPLLPSEPYAYYSSHFSFFFYQGMFPSIQGSPSLKSWRTPLPQTRVTREVVPPPPYDPLTPCNGRHWISEYNLLFQPIEVARTKSCI
ncbi:hypothetical protein CDAR_310131 [Caerostris darwini]|uniref:Uncharacterized protein n=1 Tax=Caerostris darwini TaxID=1538125 RepID=A0AAV4WU38_9ARAC|nr:hypothetical protein CDAR_310131 [Caerostris darwini]